ncbi:MAG: heavy metal-binding domain-containing protein [Planctomycetia bacterium]|nr:heavy metal-binding domain-containing protein [Planctomycetia bacterium]
MLITTTENIPGQTYVALGLVKGTIVQSKNVVRDFMAGLKTVVGGEIKGYTEMMMEARNVATQRMIAEATSIGADAIVMVRYASSAVMQNSAEVIAYGTAVKYLS